MVSIELIYSGDCPNVEEARGKLRSAIRELGLNLNWKEWDRQREDAPGYTKHFGSPAILINGKDVAPAETSEADCCRLYRNESNGTIGAPSISCITAALLEANSETRGAGFRWKKNIAIIPAVGAVFIPGITCPACWPAYAGLLGSLGIGFINYSPYLLPLVVIFLLLAIASLFYKAKERRGYRPFLLGLTSALLLIVGRFVFQNAFLLYCGVILLIAASVWNSWPVKKGGACPLCKNE